VRPNLPAPSRPVVSESELEPALAGAVLLATSADGDLPRGEPAGPEPLLEPGAAAADLPGPAQVRLGEVESEAALTEAALTEADAPAAGSAHAGPPAPGPDSQDLVPGQSSDLTGGFDQDILL